MATVKKSKKGKIITAVAIVLVIAILGTVIGVAAQSNKKPVVSLYTIGTGNINESVSATGMVSSGSVKEYKVGSVATVKEVYVKVVDVVQQRDLLATFDTSELDAQEKKLRDSYNQANASYKASVSDQKTAKNKLAAVNAEIEELEPIVEKLAADVDYSTTTTKRATTQPTTRPTTTTTTTTTTTATTTTATTTTTERATYPSTIAGAVEALTDLVATITALSDDIQQTNALIRVVMGAIATEIENGNLSSEAIAKAAGDAMAQAIRDGIIEETKLIIESGVAVDMVEAAVANVNWSAVGSAIANSANVNLATAQLRLAALYAEQKLFDAESSDDVVFAKKQVVDTAKSALDTVSEANDELSSGWKAAFNGTITAVNIYEGEQTNLLSEGITLQNLDQKIVTLSLGEYDIHKVKVGMNCKITTAYGSYTGEVITKAPIATGGSSGSILDSVGSMAGISGLSSLTDSGAGVEVQVGVNNPDDNIIVGFDADVEIGVGDYQGIITVPIESIVLEKTGTYVYLYNEEEGTVTKTLIETGAVSDSVYEVRSGLKTGDKIVATPSSEYKEDTFEVKVK